MKKIIFLCFLFFFTSFLVKADEGMWIPLLLEQMNEKKMKAMGMKISASDIYNINKGSLKDAILSFGGGCTGEVISDKGLVLTNHHCGFGAIQNHSTIDHNYLRDGFWAKNYSEELPNPGLFVTFIVRIEDVSKRVMTGVTQQMKENERQSIIDKNIYALKKTIKKEAYQEVLIKPFYEGNQYYLFITETYNDVRLVGAPPSAIGNFGKDTDNWVWPRHTGDFSMFRIYAGKENKPADFSPDNIPYVPKKSLTISLKGMKQGDFTMVFGFPGRTNEYLPGEAVAQIATINDPAKILVRDKTLAIMNKYMRSDEAIKIQYASKYAGIANAWKKWKGEVLGLTRTNVVEKKKEYEEVFKKRINENPILKNKYQNTLPNLIQAYKEIKPYSLARDYYLEITGKIEMFAAVNRLRAIVYAKEKKQQAEYEQIFLEQVDQLAGLYSEYNATLDKEVFSALMKIYMENQSAGYVSSEVQKQFLQYGKNYEKWANAIYNKSIFCNGKELINLLKLNPEEAYTKLQTDEAAKLLISMANLFDDEVAPKLNEIQPRINNLQRSYMQAQIEVFKEKIFYPDANSTMRIAYGKVNGYRAADAKDYDNYTYLDGVMEKYIPGDYEFDVPQKLRDLYKSKEYGRYGMNGKMPICFIATNHTTGGNSGSPALDAYGNLVGLNFDRVWEGTMSDINFDASICRNVMVDIRYVLFIIDKYAGAGHLINEMKIVSAKK
jgi:hypothetical protein